MLCIAAGDERERNERCGRLISVACDRTIRNAHDAFFSRCGKHQYGSCRETKRTHTSKYRDCAVWFRLAKLKPESGRRSAPAATRWGGTLLELAATSAASARHHGSARSAFAASRGLVIDVENRGGRRAESRLADRRRHCARAESYFQSLDSVDSPTDRTSSRPAPIADAALFKASES